MEFFKDVKVYHDGSHYVGIPKELQPWKRKKTKKQQDKSTETLPVENKENKVSNVKLSDSTKNVETACDLKKVFDGLYEENRDKNRKEKFEIILNEIKKYLEEDKAKEFIKTNFERKLRNYLERRKRLIRKVRQQQWNYFCTFTYDDKLHNEDSFRKTLSNCLKHLASRKDWKYIGVWERSPTNQRLHFHGLFLIPQMVGEFEELHDYSTKSHKMQTTIQNTFFLKRFGRNDFSPIEHQSILDQSIQYLMKYLEKSGEKIVYSKGLYTYFVTDILEEDVICTTGVENRKVILHDDFKCFDLDTGEYFGTINNETKEKLKKSN